MDKNSHLRLSKKKVIVIFFYTDENMLTRSHICDQFPPLLYVLS